jgi:hypothetical protein
MVSAVQCTTNGIIEAAESSSEIGAMLHDAGYTSAMLDKKSDKRKRCTGAGSDNRDYVCSAILSR